MQEARLFAVTFAVCVCIFLIVALINESGTSDFPDECWVNEDRNDPDGHLIAEFRREIHDWERDQ